MKNIILIGNGFDLAHQLNTKYEHFIDNTLDEEFSLSKSILDKPVPNKIGARKRSEIQLPNQFYDYIKKDRYINWCDFERDYFTELLQTQDPKNLNSEFERIKDILKIYLNKETINVECISPFKYFFSEFSDKPTVITFNYTKTIRNYKEFFNELIYLHGELNDSNNPIIFGYAADSEKTQELIKKDDVYLKNIKQYEYLGANNFRNVLNILKDPEEANIFLLGVSCGLSDKLILGRIFGHQNVKRIFNLYYKNRSAHLAKLINVNRIVGEDIGFNKFMPLPETLKMPQKEDSNYKEEIDVFFKGRTKYGL